VILLVALLVVFKVYRQFGIPWVSSHRLPTDALALIGFSYFLFRAIGFLHIQSILPIDEKTPWGLLYFLLFPPTLTSGPIHKFQDFRQQLERPAPLDGQTIRVATYRITRGFFRKLVVAFVLNQALEKLLADPSPTFLVSILIVAFLYLYFYFDFAGYSDIAIGFGLLMGIRVPENFRKPFQATSVSEFWRNWHITLVDWLRENVFIPLGGMQGSRLRASALAFLIMFLCGLWHGLTWSFVAWGIWHGTILFAEGMLGTTPMPPSQRRGPRYWWRVSWTNARVAAGSLFFLPDTATTLRVLGGFVRL
jgi:alginate O-acetyltransferase complex protein AlgI